jgi:small subunit ribosomal protein S16
MLKIRLQRVGRVHEPVFRLVLTDSKHGPKSGKVFEVLGSYDARQSEKAQINGEQALHWLSKGAQASDTAHNLLIKLGILKGTKRNVIPAKVIAAAKAPKEVPAPTLAESEVGAPTSAEQNVGAEPEPQVEATPVPTPEAAPADEPVESKDEVV